MGEFLRGRLPEPISFFELEGLPLKGRGKWRTTRCELHDGSDSMRVNTASGAWVCMNCGAKGGDVLGYSMRRHGLGFVEAARMLGAYSDDDKPHRGPAKAAALSPRDAMAAIAFEHLVQVVVIADIRRGLIPTDGDWQRFLTSIGRTQALAEAYAS